jgi:TetR/AcrR family transcriptional regulator
MKPASPRKRDAALSRKTILAAALAEFTERGLDGARVDTIAIKSKVSKNLLYHYFKSKDRLFLTVLENAYSAMRRDQADAELAALPPSKAMEELTRRTFRHFVEHPEIVSLLASANVHKARHLEQSGIIQDLFNPLVVSIGKILERGQKEGIFRGNVDVIDLYISISGLGFFYQSCRFSLGKLFERDLEASAVIERREQHIVDMVMSYLQTK